MTKTEKIEDLQSKFESILKQLNSVQTKVSSYLGDLNYWKDQDNGSDKWRTDEIEVTFSWIEGFDKDVKGLVKVTKQIIAWLGNELGYADEWDSHKLVAELNKGLKRYKLIKNWIPYVFKYIELSAWELENNSDEVVSQMTEISNAAQSLLKQFNDNSDKFWDPNPNESKDEEDKDYEDDDDDSDYADAEEESNDEEVTVEEELDISDEVDTGKELLKLEEEGNVDDQDDQLIPEDEEDTDRFLYLIKRTHTLYRIALNDVVIENADIAKFKKQYKIPKKNDTFEMLMFCILCKFFVDKKMIQDPAFSKKENPYFKPKFIQYASNSYCSLMNTYLNPLKKYGLQPKKAYESAGKIIFKNIQKWTSLVQKSLNEWYDEAMGLYKKMGTDLYNASIITQDEAYAFAQKHDAESVDDCVAAYMNWFVMHLIKDLVNSQDEKTQDKEDPMLSINPIHLFIKQILARASRAFLGKFQQGFGSSKDMNEIVDLLEKEHVRKFKTWITRYNKWVRQLQGNKK